MAEVCWRHSPTILSPSTTPNLMLVLLQLMARSIAPLLSGRLAQQFSGHDLARPRLGVQQKRAIKVDTCETASHQFLAELHVDLGTNRPCLGEPCLPDGVEPFAPPARQPACHGRSKLLESSL